jgi:hypothetical protein
MSLLSVLCPAQIVRMVTSLFCCRQSQQAEHTEGTSEATDSVQTMEYAHFPADMSVVPLPSLIILITTAPSLLSSLSTTSISYFSNSATVEAAAKCEC